jgi:hypothetical protein
MLFGVGAKVIRALRGRRDEFSVTLVAFRFPEYRVDEEGQWDDKLQESTRRVVMLFHGFEAALPLFRLLPNNWAVSVMRGKNANTFGDVWPFGAFNYVMGPKDEQIRHVLGGTLQEQLGRNRSLTIDSRGHFLAFYLHGNRSQPDDLDAFYEHCAEIATSIHDRSHRPVLQPAAS